ncbi:type II toxin-antitoxin system VapC family toxin [Aquifex pyrophilus]
MVLVGLDTGFFIKLLEGNEEVAEVWEKITEGQLKAKTSALVLFELKRILLKLGKSEVWEDIKEAIALNCEIVSVDLDVVERGASVSYGTGLPAFDAIIYTSVSDVDVFYTTDSSFKVLSKKKKPKIRIIK